MNCEIKSAKSRYYCDLISETRGDLSKLWKAVNQASSRNGKSSIPQCIIANGAHHTNPRSISSALNSHFGSIGRILPEEIPCIARTSLPIDGHSGLFQSQEISESVVNKQLLALKANKAIGLDNINASLLNYSAHQLLTLSRS